MVDVKYPTPEILARPVKHFKLFYPSVEKLDFLADRFMNEYLYCSDEGRTPQLIWAAMFRYFSGDPQYGFHLPYEIDDFDGVLMFKDILPGWKCDVTLKYWGGEKFSHGLVRSGRELLKKAVDWYGLIRMNTDTADEKIVKLAKLCGFVEEGKRELDFRWNGRYYDRYILGWR